VSTCLHESLLLARETVADQTIACTLARPAGFEFTPGQYVDVTLATPLFDDLEGPTRSLSLASAPSDPELVVLARLRNTAFKRSLAAMPLGSPVTLDGPADDLALTGAGTRPRVFVAGGVGIAPFRSLLREAAATGIRLDATLFYSNRRPEDAAYLAEIADLARRLAGLRLIPTMTRMEGSERSWTGETEHLGPVFFRRYLGSLVGHQYYVVGSPVLVAGICRQLEDGGVPGSDIRVELYTGY
jgi:ferredoxin-NADP reductase